MVAVIDTREGWRRGLKNWDAYVEWLDMLRTMTPSARLRAYLRRYPSGTTLTGMLPWMGLGRGQRARRQLDAMLRSLEREKFARVIRAGNDGEVRLWALAVPRTQGEVRVAA